MNHSEGQRSRHASSTSEERRQLTAAGREARMRKADERRLNEAVQRVVRDAEKLTDQQRDELSRVCRKVEP